MTGEPKPPTAVASLRAMWLYTLLRFGIFFVLWGILWVARVPGFLGAVIALVLSIPLSFVLLGRQRQRMVDNLETRVETRKARNRDLDDKLSGGDRSGGDLSGGDQQD